VLFKEIRIGAGEFKLTLVVVFPLSTQKYKDITAFKMKKKNHNTTKTETKETRLDAHMIVCCKRLKKRVVWRGRFGSTLIRLPLYCSTNEKERGGVPLSPSNQGKSARKIPAKGSCFSCKSHGNTIFAKHDVGD